jgi:HPt (histidine-containing phosphotransfer) domain-containing protein
MDQSSPIASLVDFTHLDELQNQLNGDRTTVERIVGLFLKSGGGYVDTIRRDMRQNDLEALIRASHTLKSSAAMIGALALAERCRELEVAARSKQKDRIPALAAASSSAYYQAAIALRAWSKFTDAPGGTAI